MFSILDLMSEHTAFVSGCKLFIMTQNIVAPSSWVLKLYADMKSLSFQLASVFIGLLIHIHSILDIRRCLAIIACLSVPSSPSE